MSPAFTQLTLRFLSHHGSHARSLYVATVSLHRPAWWQTREMRRSPTATFRRFHFPAPGPSIFDLPRRLGSRSRVPTGAVVQLEHLEVHP